MVISIESTSNDNRQLTHDSDMIIMALLLIFQIFTKQYLAKLLHCMAWNYQAAKQKTFGSTGDCGQWNFLKAV